MVRRVSPSQDGSGPRLLPSLMALVPKCGRDDQFAEMTLSLLAAYI